MDRDEVRLAQQVVELAPLGGRGVGRRLVEDVVPEDVHAEGVHAAGDLAADPPEADHAEGFALRVVGERGLALAAAPGAAAVVGLEAHQTAREHQHERGGEVGDGVVEHARRVAERDAVGGEEVDIEGVVADRGGGDDLELGRGGEQFVVHADQRVEQDAVRSRRGGDEVGAVGPERNDADIAGGGEDLVEFVFNGHGLDDFGHGHGPFGKWVNLICV